MFDNVEVNKHIGFMYQGRNICREVLPYSPPLFYKKQECEGKVIAVGEDPCYELVLVDGLPQEPPVTPEIEPEIVV